MKTVVVPDIHQRIAMVEWILDSESSADEFVFLGDWFDSWGPGPRESSFVETCRYLRMLMTGHPLSGKFVFLVGNHDMPYIYHNCSSPGYAVRGGSMYSCSGFSKTKARAFRSVFRDSGHGDGFFLSRFRPAYRSQGVTMSHAGLHPSHLLSGEGVEGMVSRRLPMVWANFRNGGFPGNGLLSACGRARGGLDPVGGLLWLDWNAEFASIPELGPQIVGHTAVPAPSCRRMGTREESWNLDTGRDYAVIVDGRISTRPVGEALPA